LISLALKFLGLSHPAIDTRDIASFVPFRKSLGYKPSQMVPLRTLVNKFMGRDLGRGYEHPVSILPFDVIVTGGVR
jgi:RNA exonuclease 4